MEKYYFFRTVRDGSRERLRPLAGQTAHDGSAINPNFNTKGSKRMRESYPIGTVFCSKVCEQQGGYYAAGDLFPLDINLGARIIPLYTSKYLNKCLILCLIQFSKHF